MKLCATTGSRILSLLGLSILLGSFQGCLKSSSQTDPGETVIIPNPLEPIPVPEVKTPKIVSVQPASAKRGDSLELLVTGENVELGPGAGSRVLVTLVRGRDTLFSGSADTLGSSKTQAKIHSGTIPLDAPLGLCDVHVRFLIPHGTNPDAAGEWVDLKPLVGGFLVMDAPDPVVPIPVPEVKTPEPAVLSVSPASARRGEPLALTITGEGVDFSQDTHTAVWIGLVQGSDTIVSATADFTTFTRTQATIGSIRPVYLKEGAPLGLYDVRAGFFKASPAFPKGQWVELNPLRNAFRAEEYALGGPPRILSVSPDFLIGDIPSVITVRGEYLGNVESVYLVHYTRSGVRATSGVLLQPVTDSVLKVRIDNPEKLPGPADFPEWGVLAIQKSGPELTLKNSITISEKTIFYGVFPLVIKRYGTVTLDINWFRRHAPITLKGWLTQGDHRLEGFLVAPPSLAVGPGVMRMTVFVDSTVPKGLWDLHIETSFESLLLPGAVTLDMGNPPGPGEAALVSISPRTVNQPNSENQVILNLKGTGTWFTQGPFSAWLERESDSIPATLLGARSKSDYQIVSDTEAILTLEIPFHTKPGLWDVKVEQPWYTLKLAEGIEMTPGPAPTLVTPPIWRQHVGGDVTISIEASGVRFHQGPNTSVQMRLIHEGDTVFTVQSSSATYNTATFQVQTLADSPLGIYQAQVRYFLVTGSLDGLPTGEWVDLHPVVDIMNLIGSN